MCIEIELINNESFMKRKNKNSVWKKKHRNDLMHWREIRLKNMNYRKVCGKKLKVTT